jgi:hypothetical protein
MIILLKNNGWSFISNKGFADELDHPNIFAIKPAKQMAPASWCGEGTEKTI